jgi:hypothetical protein
MSNYLNVNIPTFFAFVDEGFFYDLEPSVSRERQLVEVFAYTSIPQRCGMFSVMTEYGSQHARVPIHYLHTDETGGTFYPLDWIQLWDSMSYYCSVNILDYCKNRAANIMLKNKTFEKAKYMFTLDWCFGPHYTSSYGEMAAGHKCFGANTMVLCKDGLYPINEVEVGDYVWTHENRWRMVVGVHKRSGESVSVKAAGVDDFITTKDHKILTPSGWQEIQNAECVTFAAPHLPLSRPIDCPVNIDGCFMRFLGRWIGDGCINYSQKSGRPKGELVNRIIVSCHSKECESLEEDIKLLFKNHTKQKVSENCYNYYMENKQLAEWMSDNFGRYSWAKRIPNWLYSLDKAFIMEFIYGYFLSDGHATKESNERSISTVSKKLAIGLIMLLRKCGFYPKIYMRSRENDVCTIGSRSHPCKPNYSVRWLIDNKQNTFRRDGEDRIISKIKSINDNGNIDLYDLSVEDDNSYVADGVIVHNCGHVFAGDGQYFIQPNNRVLWMDGGSFIAKKFPTKPDWKVFSQEFSCEHVGSRWVSESEDELWFYDFKEQG